MKIDFEFTHAIHGLYRDALNLPDDHNLSDEEIAAIKQQRFDKWVAYLEAPPVEQPVVEEPLIEEQIVSEEQ